MADLNVSTQEDPRVPAWSPEVEEALKPVAIMCWASESEQDSAMDPKTEGQDMGLEDPSLSLHSAVPPLG